MSCSAPARFIRLTLTCLLLLAAAATVRGGTTGRIAGRILDVDGKPVAAATVVVVGTRLGAYTDAEGQYSILNVAPGAYDLKITRLGFDPLTIRNVTVSSDNTTRQDVKLGETTLRAAEVVITAERPPVELAMTSSQTTLTSEDIEALPVQELNDVVNLQAGVVDGHFRGGRTGEVQYQVDGVSVNNAFDNKSIVSVDRSLLQEVQVISGTFDAEYGQAMSGVVNAVLKQGTEEFAWSGEAYTGGFVFPGRGDDRRTDETIHPTGILNFQASASGPTPLRDTVFLASARRSIFNDYIYATRRFLPTDDNDFARMEFNPSGDNESVPLGYNREWSGVVKLTNTSFAGLKLNYQALVGWNESRRTTWAYRFNPDGLSKQDRFSITHGLDLTRTFGDATYLDLSIRENFVEYEDFAFADVYDARYDAGGGAEGTVNYEYGAVVEGYDFTRFYQKTDDWVIKSALVSQVSQEHQLKTGFEVSAPEVQYGTPGHLVFTSESVDGEVVEQLTRYLNRPPTFLPVQTYHPRMGAVFLQDQAEYPDLKVRVGLRLEYFDANSTIPSDLANPANAIEGAPLSHPQDTTVKMAVSPRIGVAYPIEDYAAIHFAYGHFRQFPAIGTMFNNANYDVVANLQAGDESRIGVLGNPDVRPETTVQYEIGYKHAVNQDFGFTVTTFYKDVRDLLGVEFVDTYMGVPYARLTNVDFGNVFGVTVSLDHRRLGPAGVSLDYTWQRAMGNSSDPYETFTRSTNGEDANPRLVPFNWDQRHTLNLTASLAAAEDLDVSAVVRLVSGQPYTPVIERGHGSGLDTNSATKPAGMIVDLRAEKRLGEGASAFLRVFNAFDSRYFNGSIFADTGSPYYSRFSDLDRAILSDPTRFYPPRRIEIGVRITGGLL
ncbi:MAG: TonB-dependent receptor [bacterium]|nr:TonB-dependent receptor [bacterium]